MSQLPLADLRRHYAQTHLTETAIAPNPIEQFERWFQEALDAQIPEPNAMTLATVSANGEPRARIVLLKGFDERGFVFYTNYQSDKGCELQQQYRAALVFWWVELERQVRVSGQVEKVSAAESGAYFASRPRASQLGAWASPQSQVVSDRAYLEERLAELEQQYAGKGIPRPPHWGGFRVIPEQVEFWQGRPSRLHDRLRFRRDLETDSWCCERLAP